MRETSANGGVWRPCDLDFERPPHGNATLKLRDQFRGLWVRRKPLLSGWPALETDMTFLKSMLSGTIVAASLGSAVMAADDTIKVGVLHSLSGTMAISETTLKDTMLMLVEQQNAKGGVLGKQLEAVVVDPASDWPLFAEKARELLTVHNVDIIFGLSLIHI